MPETPVAYAPYEAMGIALINLVREVIAGQPPDVRAELWRMYAEDIREWRAFWKGLLK